MSLYHNLPIYAYMFRNQVLVMHGFLLFRFYTTYFLKQNKLMKVILSKHNNLVPLQ